jgi:exo-beta-1,3-glucanase (GH17 family)
MHRSASPLLLAILAVLIVLAWWLPNRKQNPPGTSTGEKFNSLSYEAYRTGESPLKDRFATAAEVEEDLTLLAPRTRAIRTYAAIEGPYDVTALAKKHGLKVWQGIWLGADRAKNAIEMAHAIDLAHRFPDTIERLVVGNEVLLRRDLPPAELIADIDHVRASVRQPVAYADVSDFWEQFPAVAPHVDVVMIHLLPYWEDTPTDVGHAVAYDGQVLRHFQAMFPGKRITIGETGWPSRGRQRQGAIPGRVAEATFLRAFMALSRAEKFDYNFFEAFDETWKYQNEGIVGANWGLFGADRREKIPLSGPLREDPDWEQHAVFSIACALLLAVMGLAASGGRRPGVICMLAMVLGAALGLAQADAQPVLYDVHVRLAATVNLAGQALLAVLAIMRAAGPLPPVPSRRGADATLRVQSPRLLLRRHGLFEDLCFLFIWTAMVEQALLVFDPRYRDFPLPSFAVPLVVTIARALAGDLPRHGGGREDFAAGAALAGLAIASAIQEGPLNGQSLLWNACALILAAPPLLRLSQHQAPSAAPTAPQVAL